MAVFFQSLFINFRFKKILFNREWPFNSSPNPIPSQEAHSYHKLSYDHKSHDHLSEDHNIYFKNDCSDVIILMWGKNNNFMKYLSVFDYLTNKAG